MIFVSVFLLVVPGLGAEFRKILTDCGKWGLGSLAEGPGTRAPRNQSAQGRNGVLGRATPNRGFQNPPRDSDLPGVSWTLGGAHRR